MKAKYALIALLAITFFGCDDNTAGLGLGMFPKSDQNINGKLTTFDVTTKSIPVGEVYAKTNIGYVGKFTDETFGTYQAGFLAQLNCPEGMTFPEAFKGDYNSGTGKMITDFDNVEKSVSKSYTPIKDDQGKDIGNCQINIYLWYDSYFGDSLTACRLSMYELDQKVDGAYWYKDPKAYYTNIDPTLYYNQETSLLGRKSYTAVDLSISDSIRNLSTYTPYVKITLDKTKTEELGKDLLTQGRTKDLYKKFQSIFPGLYVESDYGDGTILYVNAVQMDVAFLEHARDSITGAKLHTYTGKDSVIYAGRSFTSTREVIQANKLENGTKIDECIDQKDCTYLKSPAGIFTEVTLPIEEISNTLGNDTLNAVKLSIPIYNEATSDKKFGMSVPRSVLLIRKKYKDDFFKNNELSDGIKSSLFDYSSSTTSLTAYTFNNITQMVNDCLADKDKGEDWNKFVLIPVLVTKDSSSNSYYGSSSNVISIQHDLKPGYARLKGGAYATEAPAEEEQNKYKLKLEVVSTSFKQ
ncbi:DUF4270 domain-containing protein [uncultured Bacteroides sp.]|jgi:hypothetical protein|uniref:DUF4270 domain-containing protein n=1 Tax=uncultured Bacteroides sp. TaxID=162156 RepID=UPI0008205EEE|nr:DUF4270 domain-containing protein [uncultured Bacteroides sp.]SCH03728.1 Uncharacterised protein [uncultured Bacteroides sp.]